MQAMAIGGLRQTVCPRRLFFYRAPLPPEQTSGVRRNLGKRQLQLCRRNIVRRSSQSVVAARSTRWQALTWDHLLRQTSTCSQQGQCLRNFASSFCRDALSGTERKGGRGLLFRKSGRATHRRVPRKQRRLIERLPRQT